MFPRTAVSAIAAGLLLTLSVVWVRDVRGQVDLLNGETVRSARPAFQQDEATPAAQPLSQIVKTFQRQARELLVRYYDFRLGLRAAAPDHSALKALLRGLKTDLANTLPHSRLKEFVLAELDRASQLDDDVRLRRAVNEMAFWLQDVPRLASAAPDVLPRRDILVEEPWRPLKPAEVVLDCNPDQLVNVLSWDSLPDPLAAGLATYRRLGEAAISILADKLPGEQGETTAELIEIERPADLKRRTGCLVDHPVLVFLVKKTFRDKFDTDRLGQPKLKTFELKLRQVVKTNRDPNGRVSRHLVTHELLEPVLVGGNPAKGQYGLHYYKTALTALPVAGSEDVTRVQFRVLSVPDYRGRLARSRLRTAVSIFIQLENRDVTLRTLTRVQQLWSQRIIDASTQLVRAPNHEDPRPSSDTASAAEGPRSVASVQPSSWDGDRQPADELNGAQTARSNSQ